MIQRFIENIEKVISTTPLILSSNIQKQFSPDSKTVYIKGALIFIDSSILEIAIFANESRNAVNVDKYRFHYMYRHGETLFRYDNAPHHREIATFPHHKHLPDRTIPSAMPTLKELLNEISAMIGRK
ncbi:MAG TPA: hypothetical protein DCL42_07730 [Deltaproteobacteria bacterium]|nr:hypothetical protein [Deltaproteobacteria bacterium]